MEQPIKKMFIISEVEIKLDFSKLRRELDELKFAEDLYKEYSYYNVLSAKLVGLIQQFKKLDDTIGMDVINSIKLLIFDIDSKDKIILYFDVDIEMEYKELELNFFDEYMLIAYIAKIERLRHTVDNVLNFLIQKIQVLITYCRGDYNRLKTRSEDKSSMYSILLDLLK